MPAVVLQVVARVPTTLFGIGTLVVLQLDCYQVVDMICQMVARALLQYHCGIASGCQGIAGGCYGNYYLVAVLLDDCYDIPDGCQGLLGGLQWYPNWLPRYYWVIVLGSQMIVWVLLQYHYGIPDGCQGIAIVPLCYLMGLLECFCTTTSGIAVPQSYPRQLLRPCYSITIVSQMVARALLCGCCGITMPAKVLLGSCCGIPNVCQGVTTWMQ